MARATAISVENAFTRGLVTEVTGVNSPENSVSDTINIIYDRRGRARTRPGFAHEETAAVPASTAGAKVEFIWETFSSANNKTIVVSQMGSTVRFFSSETGNDITASVLPFTINLNSFKTSSFSTAQVRDTAASFASGKGYLFITHPYCSPIYVTYNSDDTITTKSITIEIRDFEGVEDNLEIDERPSTLTSLHRYNLLNQGWYATVQGSPDDFPNPVQALAFWDSERDDFPANSDAWWYYTTTFVNGAAAGPSTPNGKFDPAQADTLAGLYGNAPVPKGHYIFNAFQTTRSNTPGVGTVPESSSGGVRPSCVAFFAGRAFFAGVNANNFSSTVYFSQIIEQDEQLGRCYQLNDPTSKEAFDLLPSDGGTVKIQDIATILDLKVVGQSLYIFATNGVWSITGSNDGPFKATDYFVSKVSSFPALSRSSIVDVGGLPIWWNYEGIFALQKSEVGIDNVTNLTQTTIQSFYDDIPQSPKVFAKGVFNDQEGLVYWLYSNNEEDKWSYTNILVFDVITKGFYVFTTPTGTFPIVGMVSVRASIEGILEEPIVTNLLDPVVTISGDPVIINTFTDSVASKKTFKYLTASSTAYRWADMDSVSYSDYGTTPDYQRFFITGYRIRGDLLKRSQTNYLTVIMEDQLNASCFVQGLWDWSNSEDSGRFSNPQQVYRPRTFRNYQRSNLVIRGNGYSLQFKFFGEPGKPFIITGWAGFDTSESIP